MALLVVRTALVDRDEGAIVFIVRTDGHVVETAVRHPCHPHFDGALTRVHLGLTGVHHTLRGCLVRGQRGVLFHASCRLDRLFSGHAVAVTSLLQLLRLLEVAKLVMGDE